MTKNIPGARDWDALLASYVDPVTAYAKVAEIVRRNLSTYTPHDGSIGTNDLVERLYPAARAIGEDAQYARQRIYKALMALATRGLADCASRGSPRKNNYGTMVRPWLWHAPTVPNDEKVPAKICPHCGGEL